MKLQNTSVQGRGWTKAKGLGGTVLGQQGQSGGKKRGQSGRGRGRGWVGVGAITYTLEATVIGILP